MAFDVSAISQWNNEKTDKASIILAPLFAAKTTDYLEKYEGITGENVKLPKLESTTPWQTGSACGNTTSGSTTLTQFTMTSAPITVMESLCLNDLETKAYKAWLPKGTSNYTELDIIDAIVARKQAQIAKQVEQSLWQSKTTYTNATNLKHFNGLISVIDTAGDAVAATQQASISASTVRTIVEEIVFDKFASIPEIFSTGEEPCVFMGVDNYMILVKKLLTDNLFHVAVTEKMYTDMSFIYPGTNVRVVALNGLNANNPVDTGALPTAVKNRIFGTYTNNMAMAFNAANDVSAAKVWYSEDDDKLNIRFRFHLGVGVKYTNRVVQYTNS